MTRMDAQPAHTQCFCGVGKSCFVRNSILAPAAWLASDASRMNVQLSTPNSEMCVHIPNVFNNYSCKILLYIKYLEANW